MLVIWLGCCAWAGSAWAGRDLAHRFPGQQPFYRDRAFRNAFVIGAVVGVAVIAGLVFYRRTVYSEDGINYYAKQSLLFSSFASNGFYGVRTLLDSILTADYKMFMNLFISIPYLFLPRTVNCFMVCYALTCFVPMWFALLAVAKRAADAFAGVRRGLYYPLCMACMVLWPMFLWPATHGMPDAFGLTFAAVILLLTADYRFDRLEPRRLVCLFAATFALVLTRRWYMFWILTYYLCYAAAVCCRGGGAGSLPGTGQSAQVRHPGGDPVVVHAARHLPAALLRRRAAGQPAGPAGAAGLAVLALCLAGLVLALAKPALRGPAAGWRCPPPGPWRCLPAAGDHAKPDFGAVLPGTAFCALAAVCALRRAALARAGAGAAAAFFVLNFARAAGPGAYLSTPLLSDESLDLTRLTDLDQMAAVTTVLQNCAQDETVYINIHWDGYSGTTFAFSHPANPQLQSMILWESSVPSTHGLPSRHLDVSKYVMVTDKF